MPDSNLQVAPDVEDFTPDGYTQPPADVVIVAAEHPHPLEVDQTPTVEED